MTEIEELRIWSGKKIMEWEYKHIPFNPYGYESRNTYWWIDPKTGISPQELGSTDPEYYFSQIGWTPDIPSSGQIWLVVETLYTVHHWSLRLNLTYPAIGDGEKGARVYLYSGRTYCNYQAEPYEWGGPFPNPYVAIQSPKATPFITDPNPCVAILKAAKAAWDGDMW
jgi:hypothetical protein